MSVCRITYNGVQISETEEDAPISVVYNGSTIASVDDGETKTLNCDGKYMASDLLVGTKRLLCGGKMMSGNVGVDVESGKLYVTLVPNQTDATNGMYVEIGGTTYYNNSGSAVQVPVSAGDVVKFHLDASLSEDSVYFSSVKYSNRRSRYREVLNLNYALKVARDISVKFSGNRSVDSDTGKVSSLGDFLIDGIPENRIIGYSYNTYSETPLEPNYRVRISILGDGNYQEDSIILSRSNVKTVFMDYVTFEAFAKDGVYVNGVLQPSNTVRFRFNSLDFTNNEFHYDRTGIPLLYKYYVHINGDVTVL